MAKLLRNQGWRSLILFNIFIVFYLLLAPISVWATVIQFPDQELASEYVFPVFKKTQASLNRNVTLSNRIELRASGAFRTDEPFFHPLSALGSLSFYWNESHGIGLSGLYFVPGLSKTGKNLRDRGVRKGATGTIDSKFDVSKAPQPQLAVFLNYQFSPLYGKISITKTVTFNFAFYSFLGGGVLGLKHRQDPIIMTPASHFGIGQKFYINRYFALDGGIDFLVYYGPNPVLKSLKYTPPAPPPPAPPYTDFDTDLFFRFLARAGITVLL